MKNRPVITIIIILVLLAVAAYLLLRRANRLPSQQAASTVPVGLASVVPADWQPLPSEQQYQCDFDGDGESEWLIPYHYDAMQVQQPLQNAGTLATRSPIGAAIFDAQNNPTPSNSGNPSPYQPTIIIPYRLLPDLYAGKGQGYLGESSVAFAFYPPLPTRGGECKVDEITVLGYSDANGDLPTRLSIFRWQDAKTGYIAAAFVGDEQIVLNLPQDQKSTVTQLTTYNRLHNHRSLLCAVQTYKRDTSQPLAFNEDESQYTIDFCFGSPADPTYPEGVVVSYLRGNSPKLRSATAPSVPTKSFLLNNTAVPTGVEAGPDTRIMALANPASVGSYTTGGQVCTDQQTTISTPAGATPIPGQGWICGRASATIETEVVFPDITRRVRWELTSLNPEQVNGDVHWRISNIEVVSTP
jgi:hypothetical protein